jgi:hypothetical protein
MNIGTNYRAIEDIKNNTGISNERKGGTQANSYGVIVNHPNITTNTNGAVARRTAFEVDGFYRAFEWEGKKSYGIKRNEGSFLLDIRNGNDFRDCHSRDRYFEVLFTTSIERANNKMLNGEFQHSGHGGRSVEYAIARFEMLYNEIHSVFGHDEQLLADNLSSLERGFEHALRTIAKVTYVLVRKEMWWAEVYAQEHARWMAQNPLGGPQNPDTAGNVNNNLANHKDFNLDEFEQSTREMMQQFAQTFLEHFRVNSNVAEAHAATTDLMNQMFSETKSVSNLSFSDFMLVKEYRTGGNGRNQANTNFNKHKNLQ